MPMHNIHTENITGKATLSTKIGQSSNYISWILSEFTPYIGSSLLEAGIGYGDYIPLLPENIQYTGCDLDHELVKQARLKFPDKKFIEIDIADENFCEQLQQTATYDTVLSIGVLGFIPNYQKALDNMINILQPGGHLLLFLPAFSWLKTDIDNISGQVYRYNCGAVRTMLAKHSVEIMKLHYFNSIGAVGTFCNKIVRHKSLEDKIFTKQMDVFDKYLVPIAKFVDPITRNVFGQSVIAVIKKKTGI